jgi:hypothetical protein
MKTISLPKNSPKERHNHRCFEDFKNFIQTYIENPEEKRYHEYRFEADLIKNEDPVLVHKRKDVLVENVVDLEDVITQLGLAAKTFEFSDGTSFSDVQSKIELVTSHFNEVDRKKIYSTILIGGKEAAIQSILNNNEEQLVAMAKEALPFIKLVNA